MSDYEMLREAVNIKCPSESFDKVNQCIENKIPSKDENDKIRKIKSLICYIEGKLNETNSYTLSTISFAAIIGGITIASSIENDCIKTIFMILLFAVAAILIIHSNKIFKSNYKDTFILKALNFKLDELIEESKRTEEESVSDKKKETKGKKKVKSKRKGKK